MGAALRLWRGALLLWALAAGCGLPVRAQAVLPVPALTARVIDQTGTLDAAQRQALEDRLAAFEARSGPQVVVLMVATTAPEDIAAYAFRVADAWKIGRREVGDGLLLVVAMNDRRARIEVARALEGAVPDLAARQIIDRELVPAFRAGDYAGGLGRAVDALIARLSGEGLPAPTRTAPAADGAAGLPDWVLVAGALLPVVITVARWVLGVGLASALLGSAGAVAGWWAFGWWGAVLTGLGLAMATLLGVAGLLQVVLSSGGGGGGGGGSGRGGGGFSSGGGGSFGGGGASGSW
jgi:uncharacterized protein